MVIIFTRFQDLCLETGLQARLSQSFPELGAKDIPLSLCFQRRGLGFRSAIALKLAQQAQTSPHSIAQQCLTALSIIPAASFGDEQWSFEAIATTGGWLEFFLTKADLGRWLDLLLAEVCHPAGFATDRLPKPPFSFQYLHARCHSLATLAAHHCPQVAPAWHFEDTDFPDWEQTLLEAIAALGLAMGSGKFHHRLLVKVEQAFWEFHRHCPLFYFLREEPSLGSHYCQWITLLEKLFYACLEEIYQVTAIAEL